MAIKDVNNIIQSLTEGYEIVPDKLIAEKGAVQWDTDPEPEFFLDTGSERYRRCQIKAEALKEQYPLPGLDPSKPEDRKIIVERENAITTELVNEIHKEENYWDYNKHVANGASSSHPTLHNDIKKQNTKNPASLSEFKAGELICRHYGPLFFQLAKDAGMSTLTMTGEMNHFTVKDGKVKSTRDLSGQSAAGHLYVISALTGNIIEATAENGKNAYQKISNSLSPEEMIAGKTAISASNNINYYTYGSYFYGDKKQQEILEDRLKRIRKGDTKDLPYYNVHKSGETQAEHDATRIQEKNKTHAYDLKLVQDHYDKEIKPLIQRYEAAVNECDIKTIKECYEKIPFDNSSMAEMLKTAIRKQESPNALAMAEFAIDHGALEGFKTRPKNDDLLFSIDLHKEKLNEDFASGLVKKLGVTPQEYLDNAIQTRWAQHIKLALDNIPQAELNVQLKSKLEYESGQLKLKNFKNQAAIIDEFIDNAYYKNNPKLKKDWDAEQKEYEREQKERRRKKQSGKSQQNDLPWVQIIAGGVLALVGLVIGAASEIGAIGTILLTAVLAAVGIAGSIYLESQKMPSTAMNEQKSNTQTITANEPSTSPELLQAALERGTTQPNTYAPMGSTALTQLPARSFMRS